MIIAESDEHYRMITQNDHGDLAGQFAAHWGNEQFARLKPYQSMVLVRGKLIPRTQYKSQDEFREAYGKGQRELFEFTLLATGVSHPVQDPSLRSG